MKKPMKWLLILNASCLASLSLGIFYVFVQMWRLDLVKACEDILWVRALETGMAAGFFLLGVGTLAYWFYFFRVKNNE